METMENMETTNTVKRKSLYYGDGTTVNKKQTLSIYDSLFNYFNETTEDEENYINEVSNYFNMLNDAPVTCANLPDVKKNNYAFEELSEGQQIYVKGKENENIIYIIKEKNVENKTIKIQQNNINRIDEGNIISADKVENIININPDSLHIDPTYLAKINTTDPKYFGNTKEGLILKIKYYKTKITICRIKIKKYANNKTDPRTDNVVAGTNEKKNLTEYKRLLEETIRELANISDEQSINIDDINNFFRGLYGIGNMSNALDIFNNNIFTTFFKLGVNKDVIIRKYIILMDCLSVIGIAGIVEFTNLLLIGKDPRSGWVYFCIETFIKTMPPQIKNGFINYALLPCISYYLCTNMDTLYLITNNSLTTFFDYILCGLNNVSNIGATTQKEVDDEATIMTSNSNISGISNNTITKIKGAINDSDSDSDSDSASTFKISISPSETPTVIMKNIMVNNNKKENVSLGSELYENLKIITQNNSVVYSQGTNNSSWSGSSQGSSLSSQESRFGGKIKRSRVTKKHKRITIRGSKRSKKMKGGKRTRSTKKRRVVRKKKCNTKKR